MRKILAGLSLAVIGAVSTLTASAIQITSGDIKTVDPAATEYGAVRFKDFINAGDGGRGGNLYLQNNSSSLTSSTGSDGRSRVDGNPLWTVGTANSFWFEYRPEAGTTDKILSGATDRTDPGFSRVIDDPSKPVNFISFYIQSNEGAVPTTDSITLNLLGLDGSSLTPGSLTFGYPPGGSAKWYLTDSSLLANGFILTGTILPAGGIERTESDKVQIAFGNFSKKVPDGGTTLLLLGLALTGLAGLRRKIA